MTAPKTYATIDDAIAAAGLTEAVRRTPELREQFVARADARAELEQAVKAVMPELRCDGRSDREIHTAVLSYVRPDLKLTDRSDGYVAGRFEAAMSRHLGVGAMRTRLDAAGPAPAVAAASTLQQRLVKLMSELSDAREQQRVTADPVQQRAFGKRADELLDQLLALKTELSAASYAGNQGTGVLADWQRPLAATTRDVTPAPAQSGHYVPDWQKPLAAHTTRSDD